MTHAEIVKKLIGQIKPVGETNEDAKRLDNLNDQIQLTEELINEIFDVAHFANRHEFSVKTCGLQAKHYLKLLRDRLNSLDMEGLRNG
jgi:hypothetical protein